MKGEREMDEANLVKCWQDGNIEAFRTLYEQYSNRALRTAFLITGRMDIAEDAVQDAFIQSNSQIKQLKDAQKFRPWFYRILVRQSWHYSSKEKGKISFDDIDFKAKSDTMHAPELIVRFETKRYFMMLYQSLVLHLEQSWFFTTLTNYPSKRYPRY